MRAVSKRALYGRGFEKKTLGVACEFIEDEWCIRRANDMQGLQGSPPLLFLHSPALQYLGRRPLRLVTRNRKTSEVVSALDGPYGFVMVFWGNQIETLFLHFLSGDSILGDAGLAWLACSSASSLASILVCFRPSRYPDCMIFLYDRWASMAFTYC